MLNINAENNIGGISRISKIKVGNPLEHGAKFELKLNTKVLSFLV